MNAVIYCRVSSKKQEEEGHGIESQEFACRDFAKKQGWKVLKVFADRAYSGAIEDRPQANEMLVYLMDQPNTIVLMDDISRQARDREIYYSLKAKIQKLDCQVRFINLDIPDNEDGDFFELMSVGLAEWMRKKNRAQVLRRMQSRLGSGYWCFYPPRGYQFGEDKTLVFKEPDATILKSVLENFAEGYIQNQTEAMKILNQKGFKTSRTKVKDILIDPIYTGAINYPKWNVYVEKAKHPALISTQTHLKILNRFDEKPSKARNVDHSQFLFRGVVKCSECGKTMQSFITTKSTKKGVKKYYPKYDCRTKDCKFSYKSISKDKMEAGIDQELKELQPKESLIKVFALILDQVIKDYQKMDLVIKDDVKKEIAQVEKAIERVVKRIADTERDSIAEALEDELEKLYKQKMALQAKLEMGSGKLTQENLRTAVNEICDFLKNLDKRWIKSDLKMKKLILNLVYDDQIVYDQNLGLRTQENSYLIRLFDRVVQKNSNGGLVGSFIAPNEFTDFIDKLSKYYRIIVSWSTLSESPLQ